LSLAVDLEVDLLVEEAEATPYPLGGGDVLGQDERRPPRKNLYDGSDRKPFLRTMRGSLSCRTIGAQE